MRSRIDYAVTKQRIHLEVQDVKFKRSESNDILLRMKYTFRMRRSYMEAQQKSMEKGDKNCTRYNIRSSRRSGYRDIFQ